MAISGGDGSIILTTQVDQTGLKRGMASMKSGVSSLSKSFTKIGAAIGVAFGVGALIKFGKQAVQLASDLQEVQNVVDVAFGDMAYRMEEFADTAIETFGISELTAKQTGSSFMAMAKGMQFADDVAADMALTLTGLSADMASFYNIRQEEARTALSAVYTGETETLKRYGILITEVNLQEYARQQGITKSINAMTQQEKVMLRYQYILQATQLAQGDFVRTQDSWANQTRILSERWKEMSTIFGEAFMSIGLLVLPVINSIIVGLTKVAEAARVVAQWIYKAFTGKELKTTQSQGTALSGVGVGATEAADGMEALGDATGKASKEAKKALAGFDDLQILTSNIADSAGSAGDALGGIGGIGDVSGDLTFEETEAKSMDTSAFEQSLQRIGNLMKTVWDSEPVQSFVGYAKTYLETLKTFVSTMWRDIKNNSLMTWQNIQGDVSTIVQNLTTLWTQYWNDMNVATQTWGQPIIDSISNLFNSIWKTAIDPYLQLITSVWADFTGNLVDLWDEHGAKLLNNIGEFVNNVIGLFQSIYDNILEPIITPLLENLSWLWEKHLSKMVSALGDFIMSLVNGVLEIYNKFIDPIVKFLLKVLSPAWKSLTQTVVGFLGTIIATVSDVVTGIIETFTGLIDFIVGVFTGSWEKALNGIKTTFKGVFDAIASIFKGILNGFIDTINGLVAGINGAVGLINEIPGVNIPEIPKIPKLAQGTVVPPNKPFYAMLGDNTKEHEIVSPVSMLKQAFMETVAEMGGNFGGGDTKIVLELDSREFGRAVLKQGNRESRRIGTRMVFG